MTVTRELLAATCLILILGTTACATPGSPTNDSGGGTSGTEDFGTVDEPPAEPEPIADVTVGNLIVPQTVGDYTLIPDADIQAFVDRGHCRDPYVTDDRTDATSGLLWVQGIWYSNDPGLLTAAEDCAELAASLLHATATGYVDATASQAALDRSMWGSVPDTTPGIRCMMTANPVCQTVVGAHGWSVMALTGFVTQEHDLPALAELTAQITGS